MTNTFKNLPVKALEWAVKDKLTLAVLCVLAIIKVRCWHGVYKFVSLNQFCKDFRMNKNKAKRILMAMETLCYDGKPLCCLERRHGILYIRSFSFRYIFDHKGYNYVCKNILIKEGDFEGKSLFEVERMFRNLLLKNKIYSREKIEKKAARKHDAKTLASFRYSQLSTRRISQYLNISKNTSTKYIREMERNHDICVSSHSLELVGRNIIPEYFYDGFIFIGRNAFKRKCNEYKLKNKEDIARFSCKTYLVDSPSVIPHFR